MKTEDVIEYAEGEEGLDVLIVEDNSKIVTSDGFGAFVDK